MRCTASRNVLNLSKRGFNSNMKYTVALAALVIITSFIMGLFFGCDGSSCERLLFWAMPAGYGFSAAIYDLIKAVKNV